MIDRRMAFAGIIRRNEPWIVLAAIAAYALLAVASHAQTPEPADPAIVALGADLQASNTAHTRNGKPTPGEAMMDGERSKR